MIQPWRARASLRIFSISGPHSCKLAGNQNFVGGADIGAPVDVDVAVFDGLERAVAVEHHHDVVAGHSLGELPPGGDVDRPADRG